MLKIFSRAAVVAAAIAFSSLPSFAADVAGAGSTFAFPIYTKWADSFKKESGDAVNYQGIGSGAGIKQLQAKTIVFAGTDIPMKVEDLKKNGFVQWPMVMGGITAVVNIDGVKPGQLVLDGPTLADIYLGKVTKWDDPAIKKLNSSLALPSADIQVVRRADGSGTTFNFTDYLSKVSPDWADKVGSDASVEWPVGVGAKGNDGVAGTVGQTKNSIGYVETAYVKQNNMTYVDMINKAGKHVSPTVEALQAAAANADWAHAPGYYQILTDQPGDASWPITAATFVLVYAEPSDKAASAEVVKFFDWAYKNGGAAASDLNYIPMPAAVTDMVRKTWADDIKNK